MTHLHEEFVGIYMLLLILLISRKLPFQEYGK